MVLAMATSLQAAFKPPVIVRVVPPEQGRIYFIDRGLDVNIKVGDVLNVFRQQTRAGSPADRILMGTMEITASEEGVPLGRFTVDASIQGNLLIHMKLPVKNNLVLPKLKIDSNGDDNANQTLSMQHAQMVRDFLVTNYEEINSGMVLARGFGETRPIVSNDTPENRALNRRIEIVALV
jgi:hypothetical protein|tara:strand:- start:2625 stop:3161 length:537 start_codon:yes stop_codon:yes gene_type:complete